MCGAAAPKTHESRRDSLCPQGNYNNRACSSRASLKRARPMYRQRIMLELCHYVTSAAPWADHTGFVFRAALVVLLTAMLTASAFLGEPDNASEWKERLLKEAPRALA